MAAILSGTYYSQSDVAFGVEIHQTGFGGSVTDMVIRDIELNYDNKNRTIEPGIMASSCSVTISVNSTAIENLLTAMASAAEKEYSLIITKSGSTDWYGYVLIDLVELKDSPFNYDYTIKAADGIGRTKDLEYRDSSGDLYEDKATCLEHLQNCIREIVPDAIGSTDIVLYTQAYHYATEMTLNTAVNPLEESRFSHRVFRSIARNGNIKVHSVLRVLEELCKLFNCRFYLAQGVYIFESITTRSYTSGAVYHRYLKNNSSTTTLSVSNWTAWTAEVDRSVERLAGNVELTMMSGGIRRYVPPVSSVTVNYKHYSTRNLLEGATATNTAFLDEEVEQVDDNGGLTKLLFLFRAGIKIDYSTSSGFTPAYAQLEFRISINDGSTTNYLRRTVSFTNGITYGVPFWSTSSGNFPVIIGPAYLDDTWIDNSVQFISPTLPQSGALSVDVISYSVINSSGTSETVTSDQWRITDSYLEALIDGNLDGQYSYTVYNTQNTNTGNSEVIELETLVGDGPTGNTFGAIQVLDGAFWVQSEDWRFLLDSSYEAPLGQLVSSELLSMQNESVLQLDAQFIGQFSANYVMKRGASLYMFVGGSYRYAQDIWKAIFIKMGYDRTPANPITPVLYPDYPGAFDIAGGDDPIGDIPFGSGNVPGDTGIQAPSVTAPTVIVAPGVGATGQSEPDPSGGAASGFADDETGDNLVGGNTYDLGAAIAANQQLLVYKNGVYQNEGVNYTYTSAGVVTIIAPDTRPFTKYSFVVI